MPKIENKILQWIEDNLIIFVFLAFTILGILVRLPMLAMTSGDYKCFLLPWYLHIKENGIEQQVGDYNLMYQMIIWLMTKLPVTPLYGYKILSILFDFMLAFAGAAVVWKVADKGQMWKSVVVYGVILLSPPVFLNSSAWAQCDAVYAAFAVAALAALLWDKPKTAMVLLGLSFCFKLQAVFFLPVFLFIYFRSRKFSLLNFALIPLTMIVATLPILFFGRSPLETFDIYLYQSVEYEWMAANYPSAWLLLVAERNTAHYEWMRQPAILVTVGALAVQMIFWLRKKVRITEKSTLYMAFLLAYTCVLFLPSMHERYGYLYEILAIAIACVCPCTAPLCAALVGVTTATYGGYLFGVTVLDLGWLAIINVGIYFAYVCKLNKLMLAQQEQPNPEQLQTP